MIRSITGPWPSILRSARQILDEIDSPFGDFRDQAVRSELTVILDHLVGCRPAEPAGEAVKILVDAWLEAARRAEDDRD